jgi:hypothetical protein
MKILQLALEPSAAAEKLALHRIPLDLERRRIAADEMQSFLL